MTIRNLFIGAAVIILLAASASAQGRQPQKVVLSKAVIKSISANKPKSKIPLTARVGMVRQSSVVATKPGQAAPTSVREIRPASKKK